MGANGGTDMLWVLLVVCVVSAVVTTWLAWDADDEE